MDPKQQAVDEEEVPIDDSEIQAADAQNKSDESQLPSGGSQDLKNEADDLDQNNIIDNSSGPGGKSLRGNRGDPTAADKAIDQDIDQAEANLS